MNSNYCLSCGQELNATAKFCHICGTKYDIQVNREITEVPVDDDHNTHNEVDEFLRVYTNSDKYLEKWHRQSKWNWPAFLFGPIWMGYRKLYAEAAIYIGIIILLFIIELLMNSPSLFRFIYFLISIAAGMYGNTIYYRKAKKSVEEILIIHKEKEKRQFLISKKGGTSGWGIAYGIIVLIGGSMIMGMIDEAMSSDTTQSVFNTTKSNIIFAEKVDDQLKAIRPGTTFTHGKIAAILQSNSEFAVNQVEITILKKNGGSEQILDKLNSAVDPNWAVFAFEYTFTEKGHYRVSISKPSGEMIGEGSVDIN